jgi:hypothetical protein
MPWVWSVRVAAVVLALFTASFVSFPSFPSTGLFTSSARISVNRALKADRLPLAESTILRREFGSPASPAQSQSREKVPVGCDSAFSPISAPLLATVFRRCTV